MIGRTFNEIYRILELVGGGGFADVYLGRDLRSNTVVAVKILHEHFARDPAIVQRFLREAQFAQTLVEPHVVRVLDAGQEGSLHFIVMEYVQGHTLARLIQDRGQLPVDEAVEYVRQMLQAVGAAHRAGIIHRDIKPQNVMVTAGGLVKVMDFGIAKDVGAATGTQTTMYLGTPRYMSPEQANGERATARSDLYAVAITLFELLSGQPPFNSDTPWKILNLQVNAEPPPISRFRSDVPPLVEQVLAKGLQKDPKRRFQSAEEMLDALEHGVHEEPETSHPLTNGSSDGEKTMILRPVEPPTPLMTGEPEPRTDLAEPAAVLPASSSEVSRVEAPQVLEPVQPEPVAPAAPRLAEQAVAERSAPERQREPDGQAAPAHSISISVDAPRSTPSPNQAGPLAPRLELQDSSTKRQPPSAKRGSVPLPILAAAGAVVIVVIVGAIALAGSGHSGGASPTPAATAAAPVLATATTEPPTVVATRAPASAPTQAPAPSLTPTVVPTPSAVPTEAPTSQPSPTAPPVSGPSWKVLVDGSGSGPIKLIRPFALALDAQGNVYIVDAASYYVQKVLPSGGPASGWAAENLGSGQFEGAAGIAVDGQGDIYVAESGNNRIRKLDPSGKPIAQWGTEGTGPGQFEGPSGLAVDGQGNVYVADTNNNRIQKLSPTGQPIAQWGSAGNGPGQFHDPVGVAVDGQGNIYVSDTNNNRIQKLSASGKPEAQWGTKGNGPGQLNGPAGLSIGPGGDVYVADSLNNRIQIFSATGQSIARLGTQGTGQNQFQGPDDVAVDASGRLYVADAGNRRVVMITR